MNTTTAHALPGSPLTAGPVSPRQRAWEIVWSLGVIAALVWLMLRYGAVLDVYEKAILAGSALTLGVMGHVWPALRVFAVSVGAATLIALSRYGTEITAAEGDFLLKYFLASQSAILWMSALVYATIPLYFAALFTRSEFTGKVASAFAWLVAGAGFTGLFVRWRESWLISPDIGHIPVSNLYEVFVLFVVITTLIYLWYEGRYRTRALGGFAFLVIGAATGFLLWYSFARGAHEIQPLVPALQSWWMKIHVPANFIGYGSFALAAMVAVAYLLHDRALRVAPDGLLARLLPDGGMLDHFVYRAIALGFGFFTIATILGAMWAADAWGGYWSWDPKETWALIVWLNYAAWLHMRLTRGWRGAPMAWWAVVGLLVTLFAFLGVNMFLSGLHSYGEL